ncbi:hypothetical protein D8674_030298 [Pyrus ussuriensis x Pyrus communis]|uniref:Uncharacterized protein n=1 Tax=Pyrus ussuriensis x Pyrus communis TaxID=2448454 RepID=A0A5N5EV10_9ROSA|nr:hypothetical protein D8674_030298 [Pyrus ussuriensis x Pyrus communis]
MISLCNLKSLRLGISIFSSTFASKDLKTSHFPLQIQLLCRQFSSESSENHHDFTVNYLINSCGLAPENAISASKTIKLQSPERADSVLALLGSHGFSQTQISKLVRSRPHSIGVSREDVARIVAYSPNLLVLSLRKRIVPTYEFLRSMLSEKNAASLSSANVEPNIGILRESGMPQSCISLLLARFPRELMWKTEKFGEVVDVVKQMGFNLEKSTSAVAISTLCGHNGKSRWDQNLEVYKRWGWSEDDVLSAFRRFPQFLLLKGLVNIENLSLNVVLKSVEKKFLESFVTRYLHQVPQIVSVYHGNVDIQDVLCRSSLSKPSVGYCSEDRGRNKGPSLSEGGGPSFEPVGNCQPESPRLCNVRLASA